MRKDNWRWHLDSRDPDYEEPPEVDVDVCDEPDYEPDVECSEPGPWNYVPPGEH